MHNFICKKLQPTRPAPASCPFWGPIAGLSGHSIPRPAFWLPVRVPHPKGDKIELVSGRRCRRGRTGTLRVIKGASGRC